MDIEAWAKKCPLETATNGCTLRGLFGSCCRGLLDGMLGREANLVHENYVSAYETAYLVGLERRENPG